MVLTTGRPPVPTAAGEGIRTLTLKRRIAFCTPFMRGAERATVFGFAFPHPSRFAQTTPRHPSRGVCRFRHRGPRRPAPSPGTPRGPLAAQRHLAAAFVGMPIAALPLPPRPSVDRSALTPAPPRAACRSPAGSGANRPWAGRYAVPRPPSSRPVPPLSHVCAVSS